MSKLLRHSLDLAAWACIAALVVVVAVAQRDQRRDVARDVGGFP